MIDSDVAAAALLKSKLTGPALRFLTQKPNFFKSNDINEIEKEFSLFFALVSKTQSLVDFNNLMLQPAESIRNFAHRLDVLTTKVHSEIQDNVTINNIKFLKFISALPSNLRVKLQEEGITEYIRAVERAQNLQEIFSGEKILNACTATPVIGSFAETLNDLNEKINALQISLNKNNKNCNDSNSASHNDYDRSYEKKRRSFSYKESKRYSHDDRFKKNSPQNYKYNVVFCQLCRRKGHEANYCFKWTRASTQRSNFNRYTGNNNHKFENERNFSGNGR